MRDVPKARAAAVHIAIFKATAGLPRDEAGNREAIKMGRAAIETALRDMVRDAAATIACLEVPSQCFPGACYGCDMAKEIRDKFGLEDTP